ncbi:hypothetical protein [Pandoravirus japonicus]|uniref:Uncharacterized protein n=1 Tax=Pandoravirus japonicus TaxID=2823154 RepID=A0A811BSK1_9VIRU|nr:hypothetical protein [Pandoravirus japonicus]
MSSFLWVDVDRGRRWCDRDPRARWPLGERRRRRLLLLARGLKRVRASAFFPPCSVLLASFFILAGAVFLASWLFRVLADARSFFSSYFASSSLCCLVLLETPARTRKGAMREGGLYVCSEGGGGGCSLLSVGLADSWARARIWPPPR